MYRYRVTLEALSPQGVGETVQFEVENHDDIPSIVGRVPSRFGLDADATKALIVSFKLFAEVVLKRREDSPFREVRPALREFAQSLKQQGQDETGAGG